MSAPRPRRVVAIASAGGHWVQLWRLRPAWNGCEVTWITTTGGFRREVQADADARGQPAPGYVVVPEANRWQKLRLLRSLAAVALALLRIRPDAVVTTGAAPGLFALAVGRRLGARTVWIDSIANAGALSLSGRRAASHSDLWLTQWPALARREGPEFQGAVL